MHLVLVHLYKLVFVLSVYKILLVICLVKFESLAWINTGMSVKNLHEMSHIIFHSIV